MTDRPYTDETLQRVTAALVASRWRYREDQARAVLDALAAEGLLVTPRLQRDTVLHARAYIWRRPGGDPLVLNPVEVDVVLPPGPVVHASHCQIWQAPPPGWPLDGFSCNCGGGNSE